MRSATRWRWRILPSASSRSAAALTRVVRTPLQPASFCLISKKSRYLARAFSSSRVRSPSFRSCLHSKSCGVSRILHYLLYVYSIGSTSPG